jgi:hypothetical protein
VRRTAAPKCIEEPRAEVGDRAIDNKAYVIPRSAVAEPVLQELRDRRAHLVSLIRVGHGLRFKDDPVPRGIVGPEVDRGRDLFDGGPARVAQPAIERH